MKKRAHRSSPGERTLAGRLSVSWLTPRSAFLASFFAKYSLRECRWWVCMVSVPTIFVAALEEDTVGETRRYLACAVKFSLTEKRRVGATMSYCGCSTHNRGGCMDHTDIYAHGLVILLRIKITQELIEKIGIHILQNLSILMWPKQNLPSNLICLFY